jgi:hypothetical protein
MLAKIKSLQEDIKLILWRKVKKYVVGYFCVLHTWNW